MATAAEHLANGIRNGSAKAEEGIRRKSSQLGKFFDDVEELLRRVSTLDDENISRLRNKVEGSIENARAATSHTVHAAVESTKKAAVATDDYVRANPWKVIGATAAVAVLVGALLRGSRK